MRRLLACTHGTRDPASRFRVMQFTPHFEQAGWQVVLRPNRPARPWRPIANPMLHELRDRLAWKCCRWSRSRDVRDAAACDVVLVNRDLLGIGFHFERLLLERNPRVIFDFDDAIFLGEKAQHVEWMCRHAAWTTVGNEYLARFARQFSDRVTILPTVVDVSRYVPAPAPAKHGQLRLGWCGSDLSIRETLFPHLPMLARLQRRHGFSFTIVSAPRPVLPDCDLRWEFVQWSAAVETRLHQYTDAGVMPLVDDEFQRGKCGLKLLQYMAAALPSIASPVGANSAIVRHGETGYLAASEDEWSRAVEDLIAAPERREQMGRAARLRCEREFSLQRWFPVLLELVERVGSGDVKA